MWESSHPGTLQTSPLKLMLISCFSKLQRQRHAVAEVQIRARHRNASATSSILDMSFNSHMGGAWTERSNRLHKCTAAVQWGGTYGDAAWMLQSELHRSPGASDTHEKVGCACAWTLRLEVAGGLPPWLPPCRSGTASAAFCSPHPSR